MIRNLNHLKRFAIGAPDGPIGKVKDVYFDDAEWAVRYLVVDTGRWLSGRMVLVSPLFIRDVDWAGRAVAVRLSREQVKDSPHVDFDKPVSRQQEAEYFSYYGEFGYWTDDRESGDAHLRSTKEVRGYHVRARDGSIGHIEDFLFDDDTWRIASVLVDTRNWLPGKHVLVPPRWIDGVDWRAHAAQVAADRQSIQNQPEYPYELASLEAHVSVDEARRPVADNQRKPR